MHLRSAIMMLFLGALLAAMPARAEDIYESLKAATQTTAKPAAKSAAQKPQAKPTPAAKPAAKPQDNAPSGLRNTQILKNIKYGDDPAQTMDVYAPYGPGNAPVLLFAYDNTWEKGDKDIQRVLDDKVRHWTGKGLIVASMSYRKLPDADVQAQAEDIARAVYHVQTNARTWGGDGGRIVVGGHAAAAHLVMLAASDPAINRGVVWQGNIALDSLAYDVNSIMRKSHPRFYNAPFGTDQDFWRLVSPYERMDTQIAPSLLVCSTQRRWGCDEPEKVQAKGQRLGTFITVLPVDKSHNEINADLGKDSPYTDAVDAFLTKIGILP